MPPVAPVVPGPALTPIELLIDDLSMLDADLSLAAEEAAGQIASVHPNFQRSALNLVHYLALRNHDIRQIQTSLADLGISSLGRSEAHVQASLRAVLGILHVLIGRPWSPPVTPFEPVGLHEGRILLARHTERLLGPGRPHRSARIMVTAATDLATNADLMRDLVRAGMDILRINCAHDDETVWAQLIANLRQAEHDTGIACRVIMDLAGPKLRTGPVMPGPEVVKWRPARDAWGNVVTPARIWLGVGGAIPPAEAGFVFPVDEEWLAAREPGDLVTFQDTRGAARELTITAREAGGWWAESSKTSYVGTGTVFEATGAAPSVTEVRQLPGRPGAIPLATGDTLIVTRTLEPGTPARTGEDGESVPARIGCTLEAVFDAARPGERIWFDDGKFGGVIREVTPDALTVEITKVRGGAARLRGEKGINLPDTDLNLPALTAKDISDLPFVAANADMIDFSFVSQASDVADLHGRLEAFGSREPGIVLKIETRRAFERLPELVLEAMREDAAGIMIARGDLAVEIGYERLAEVQEEILWLAEAAHLPVIWATQVLETLAQTGVPSRSEITDAAMGERAECVMLNKGPHIVEAVETLDSILERMDAHQSKKRSLLRRLHAWASHEDA